MKISHRRLIKDAMVLTACFFVAKISAVAVAVTDVTLVLALQVFTARTQQFITAVQTVHDSIAPLI